MYTYHKMKKGYTIEKNGKIISYSQLINGAKCFTNYLWVILLFVFGIGFSLTGLSSYLNKDLIPFQTLSNIKFIPQGILLLFYGIVALLLSGFILSLIKLDIGSGINIYDCENSVIRISRRGLPNFKPNLSFNQKNIYLVYPFSEILDLELNIIDGLNPKRIIYLNLKDGRQIPLTQTNQLTDLATLEKQAIFITKFLKINLKLKNN